MHSIFDISVQNAQELKIWNNVNMQQCVYLYKLKIISKYFRMISFKQKIKALLHVIFQGIVFAFLGLFWFQINFRNVFFSL